MEAYLCLCSCVLNFLVPHDERQIRDRERDPWRNSWKGNKKMHRHRKMHWYTYIVRETDMHPHDYMHILTNIIAIYVFFPASFQINMITRYIIIVFQINRITFVVWETSTVHFFLFFLYIFQETATEHSFYRFQIWYLFVHSKGTLLSVFVFAVDYKRVILPLPAHFRRTSITSLNETVTGDANGLLYLFLLLPVDFNLTVLYSLETFYVFVIFSLHSLTRHVYI